MALFILEMTIVTIQPTPTLENIASLQSTRAGLHKYYIMVSTLGHRLVEKGWTPDH